MAQIRRCSIIGACLTLMLAVAACSGSGSTQGASSGGTTPTASTSANGTLTIGLLGAPSSLNPATAPNGVFLYFLNPAYSSLTVAQPNGTIVPGLAASWRYLNANDTSFEFTLKPGFRYNDGTPVTAQSAVNSLLYVKKNAAVIAADLMPYFSQIQATGPLTVRITLSNPVSNVPLLLSQLFGMGELISPAGLQHPAALGSNTFGAGPYELDTSATINNSTYTYVPNPHFPDPSQRHWQKIVLKIIPTPSSLLAAVESNQVQ
ncbi:MAG: ABC transporter substrate-binding protein [Acidimicrobiales bacterium]